MSEDIIDETEPKSDKEMNFANLRAKLEEKEAQLAALAPLKVAETVRQAGFDPATPEGKALTRLATLEDDVDAVKAKAEEIGFKPASPLTPQERAVITQGQQLRDLNSVTTPDNPPNLEQLIAEADAAGNVSEAIRLRTLLAMSKPIR